MARPVDRAYRRWVDDPDAPPTEWRVGRVSDAFEERTGQSARAAGPEAVDRFVLENARHVCRLAAISDTRAGKATVETKHRSKEERGRVFVVDRGPDLAPQWVLDGQQIVFYTRNVAVIDGELAGSDLNEHALLELLDRYRQAAIIVTPLGGNGFIFGRGNKQFTPQVLRRVGLDNVIVIANRDKLLDLSSLHVDTGDPELDDDLAGHIDVIVGHNYRKLMRVQ